MSSELMKRLLAEARAKKAELVAPIAPIITPELRAILPTIPTNSPASKLAELRAKLATNRPKVTTNEPQTILSNEEEASLPKEAERSTGREVQDNKEDKEEKRVSSISIADRIAAMVAASNKAKGIVVSSISDTLARLEIATESPTGISGELIEYNAEQQAFIDLCTSGKSCVLIGAAGTGKTTCSQGAIRALLQSGRIPTISDNLSHKHLRLNVPGIVICAYTRRATNNSRKVQSEEFKSNCMTVHKLLEYAPEYFEIMDAEGNTKRTMQFVPTRNSENKLPPTIKTIIIEEASMLALEYYKQLAAALPKDVQWIFIGDLNQLPPIFGPAILGFKLEELPVVELTQVYRQALESPIIRLAHRILSGVPIPATEFDSFHVPSKLKIHPWKKSLCTDAATRTLAAFFKAALDKKEYDPDEDMILVPFNESCGTLELNRHIANHCARMRNATTYEVQAGFKKLYISEGDKILYDKEDAVVISMEANPAYSGVRVQNASKHLDYWGHNPKAVEEAAMKSQYYGMDSDIDMDAVLEQVVSASSEERVTQASHKIVLQLLDSERTITISKAAEVNNVLHSYALTVHKSQGSEWRKVFFCLHSSHGSMLNRELVYTAVTRAKEELYIICEPDSLVKGIKSQSIKGNTLLEKAQYFKGKHSGKY